MIYVNLADISAMTQIQSFGSSVITRVHLRGGSTFDLDKTRATKLLEAWTKYCAEFTTYDSRVIFSV